MLLIVLEFVLILLGCIMGIYCILWVPLTVGMRAVLRLREYTILMHISTVRFMRAKL